MYTYSLLIDNSIFQRSFSMAKIFIEIKFCKGDHCMILYVSKLFYFHMSRHLTNVMCTCVCVSFVTKIHFLLLKNSQKKINYFFVHC